MATVVLTSTPTVLDPGTSSTDLLVVNSGSSAVHLQPAELRLRPGQSLHVQPGGRAVSAYALTGSGQVDVTVLATGPATGGGGQFGTYASATDTGYDVVLLLGQSNMQGGDPTAPVALVDITHPRVFAYARAGSNSGKIVQAADPLQHPNTGSNGGVGPGMSFGRWYADTVPGNRRVLLVPAAYSGAGFFNGNDAERWNPFPDFSYGNTGNSLYEGAITQAQAALAAAGANSRIIAALWVQGEADINSSATIYRTNLEALIDGLRDRLAAPTLPFVIGSMLPEYIAGSNGAIDGVHQATPSRKPYTAYVLGPSGYLYSGDGLGVHYTQSGQREQGRRLVAGLATAKANTAPVSAVPAAPPVRPSDYTPPAGTADYTFASAPTGWTTSPTATLTVSGGNLQVPETNGYQTVAPPNVIDLTAHAVTFRLASPLPAAASGDIFLGITADASPSSTPQNAAGVTLTNGANPYTDARVIVGGTRTVNGGVTSAAALAVGQYRVSSFGGQLTIAYSANGTTWTTLWTGVNPFTVTGVRAFITAGHWNAADADGTVAVTEIKIA